MLKDKMKDAINDVKFNKCAVGGVVGAVGSVLASVPVFAEGETTFTITSAMLTPVTSAISSGLTVLVPIGLSVMAAMIGISLIPRIIYKFL